MGSAEASFYYFGLFNLENEKMGKVSFSCSRRRAVQGMFLVSNQNFGYMVSNSIIY